MRRPDMRPATMHCPHPRRLKLLSAAFAGALLAATGASAQTVLRVGLNDEPDALDPTISRAATARLVLSNICDQLFDMTPDAEVIPVLATGYEWSPDRKAVTLTLRPGVSFHDGEPFNAAAVKANIERNQTLPGSFRKPELEAIRSVEIVDDLTVRLDLSAPMVPLISVLANRAGMMLSPRALAELGDKFGTRPVCAGPFKFVERIPQDRIVVERFAEYWDKEKVHLDRIEFRPITDSAVRLANLRSGQLDIIERVSPTDVDQLKTGTGTKVVGVPEQGFTFLRFNMSKGPRAKVLGTDPRIRQAIDAAIDRETLVKVVFNGLYIPGNQWVDPKNPFYGSTKPVPKRDVALAKKLLAEAGKPAFAFNLIVPPERDRQEAAQVIQAMLAEAGITMNIETQENVTMLQAGRTGNYEAYFTFWSGRPDPDGNSFSFFTCKGAQNDSGYCNPALDKLLAAARETDDLAERKSLYGYAAVIVVEDRPVITLWHRTVFTGLNARIDGYAPHPDGVIRLKGVRRL